MSIQKIFTQMYSDDASKGRFVTSWLIVCFAAEEIDLIVLLLIVGINQFLVSQSSLEDVFVSLG
jgi:hypothetical protein